MRRKYAVIHAHSARRQAQRNELLATAAVKAGSWLIYRGMANAAARAAQADCIDSRIDAQIDAWLDLNLPQRSDLPTRFNLWQAFDNLASKEADEFWSTFLALIIEGLRK